MGRAELERLLFMYDACALGYLVTLLSISSWRSRMDSLGIARRVPAKRVLSPRRLKAKASKRTRTRRRTSYLKSN